MAFDLTPRVGPLPLRFGMTRVEVAAVVAQMEVPSAYANDDISPLDAIGIGPHYDASGRLDFVELSSRCYIRYGGEDLLDMTIEETLSLLEREFGAFQKEDKATYVFEKPCFMLWADGDEIRSISAFTREYYERRFGAP